MHAARESTYIQTFRKIVPNNYLHGKLLNMASFLEYVGVRKIIKSLDVSRFSLEVMGHAEEEMRHAKLLKRMAADVGGAKFSESFNDYNTLARDAAENYFQTVDGYSQDWVNQHFKTSEKEADLFRCYLCTSYLIEVRALRFYGDLLLVQKEVFGKGTPIASLLKEEEHHLAAMRKELFQDGDLNESQFEPLLRLEQEAFERFWEVLSVEVVESLNSASASRPPFPNTTLLG